MKVDVIDLSRDICDHTTEEGVGPPAGASPIMGSVPDLPRLQQARNTRRWAANGWHEL